MNEKIEQLHEEAMFACDDALIEKLKGNKESSFKKFNEAYEKEREAVDFLIQENYPEPTFSIMIKSAAILALDCRKFQEAKELANFALERNPTSLVKKELEDILEKY
ncbi:MAG: hypothetical protein ACOCQD_03880 [archaeon]